MHLEDKGQPLKKEHYQATLDTSGVGPLHDDIELLIEEISETLRDRSLDLDGYEIAIKVLMLTEAEANSLPEWTGY